MAMKPDKYVNSVVSNRADRSADPPVLEIKDLKVQFDLEEGLLKAVDGVSFPIGSRKIVGLIGESGCGKTVTAQSILRIVPKPGLLAGGQILFRTGRGEIVDLAQIDPGGQQIRNIRGKEISMIFQEPMNSLSPLHSIGNQLMEPILLHQTKDKHEAYDLAVDMLTKVQIGNPVQRMREYPHQLSGGMRQRVMIAMALSCNPRLLIADEPTTALDVTVQAQILELLADLQAQFQMSILYITHNLGVIAEICDEVAVMYLGRIVESGPVRKIFHNPLHPYTIRLLESTPRIGQKRARLRVIKGNVPIPINRPPECGFFSRCSEAIQGTCNVAIPALVEIELGHDVRCFLHSDNRELAE
ncbi:MAG: ABC transporter ATP-binding protein [Aggregatilineales bacterium]